MAAATDDKAKEIDPTKILDERVINLQECREKLKPIHGAQQFPPTANRMKNNNNIHHVVPVGIIIVLFTLYLTTTALQKQRNYENTSTVEQETVKQLQKLELEQLLLQDLKRRAMILDKLLEHENVCKDMEIFTKELRWIDNFKSMKREIHYNNDIDIDTYEFDSDENGSGDNDEDENDSVEKGSAESSSTEKNIMLKEDKILKRLKDKHNKFGKFNKSIKSKDSKKKLLEATKKSQQQQQQQTKKNSTAEPIIYLFALVFIYLLLKAASDINQHYKSQTKGDKRLRRCSLQSYAQQHKQDRRASKDSPIKHKQQHHRLMEIRSVSVDRYTLNPTFKPISEHVATKTEMLTNLRKYTSMDEQRQQQDPRARWNTLMSKINTGSLQQMSSSSNRIRGGSGDLIKTYTNQTDIGSSPNRRCSVPVSLNYQAQKVTAMPLVPLSSVARRTSIASGHVGSSAGIDVFGYTSEHMDVPQYPEVKRRVRMINRH